MNKDRGTIKWNALMLPEHVKLLRAWKEEDSFEQKTQLSAWQQEELSEKLRIAIAQHKTVTVTVWNEGTFETIVSKVARFNEMNKKLFFSTGEIVILEDVVNVESDLME